MTLYAAHGWIFYDKMIMNWNIINGIAAIDTINLVSSTLIK